MIAATLRPKIWNINPCNAIWFVPFVIALVGSSDFTSRTTLYAGVVLDLDASTSVIDNPITIPVGTTLRIAAKETASLAPRDRVGLDFYYVRTTDTATAVPQLTAVDAGGLGALTTAGTLAGLSASTNSRDLMLSGATMTAGSGLRAGSLPPLPGFLNSVGGMAYTAEPSIADFPDTFPVEVMSWDVLFPTIGSVHVEVCGILDGAANGAVASPALLPANAYHETDFDVAFPGSCSPAVVHVVGIPEPSAAIMLSLLAVAGGIKTKLLRQKLDLAA